MNVNDVPKRILTTEYKNQTYLLHKAQQKLDDAPEALFVQGRLGTQQAEHVDKVVVDCIVFGRELREEHARQVRDTLVFVLEALCHLSQLTFDLDLTSEDQEGQRHEAGTFDRRLRVSQATVQKVGVLIDQVVEADSHVTKGDNGVAADCSV